MLTSLLAPGMPSHGTRQGIWLDSALQERARLEALIAQALLVASGSLRTTGVGRLVGKPGMTCRYMRWELARALSLYGDRSPAWAEQSLGRHCLSGMPASAEQSLAWAAHASHLPGPLPPHLMQVQERVPDMPPGHGTQAGLALASVSMIRAQIARVDMTFKRHRAQLDGHDFDGDAVLRHAVEGRRDGTPARIYQAARRTRRGLTLPVLLDISHSTGDQGPDGTRIFYQQKALARHIVQASGQLGDRVALCAFHSWGRR